MSRHSRRGDDGSPLLPRKGSAAGSKKKGGVGSIRSKTNPAHHGTVVGGSITSRSSTTMHYNGADAGAGFGRYGSQFSFTREDTERTLIGCRKYHHQCSSRFGSKLPHVC